MQWCRLHKTEVLIFSLAFAVRFAYVLFVQFYAGSSGFIAFSDAKAFYYREALNLVAGHGFSIASGYPYYPNAYHTPLYPLFVAFFYALGLPTIFVILAQCALAAIVVVMFYRLAMQFTQSARIALATGIFSALEPMSIYWCGLLMSDTLFAFLLVASFYYLFQRKYVPTAIFLGLATLTRPIGLYFIPVYLLFVAYEAYFIHGNIRALTRNTLVLVVVCAAVISPWYARNKIVFNAWSLSSAGWYNLYATAGARFASEKGFPLPTIPIYEEGPDSFQRFNFIYEPFFHDTVMHLVEKDPIGFFVFEIKRSISSFFASKYWYLLHYVAEVKFPRIFQTMPVLITSGLVLVGDMAWLIIYALACVGFVERSLWPVWFFSLCIVGINAALSGIIDPVGPQMTRYSLPFFGFYFAFAGLGARFLWSKVPRQKWR